MFARVSGYRGCANVYKWLVAESPGLQKEVNSRDLEMRRGNQASVSQEKRPPRIMRGADDRGPSQLAEHWLGGSTRREEDAFQTPRPQT